MAYSAEVVKRARQRLAQAREDRESQARQRLAQAYVQVPRIREIDMELRRTMAEAARAAFAKGSDGQEELARVRERNLQLQQERSDLIAASFAPGFLDETPICPACGGSGYLGTSMCQCLQALCRQEQRNDIAILSGSQDTFAKFSLEYYPDQIDPETKLVPRMVMEKNLQKCREYAMFFSKNSGNLLFSGSTGLGKTFLAACIAQTVTGRGYSVVYETAAHLFAKLEAAKFTPNEENRREAATFTECDLLILDDLGTEMPGQFVTAALYSLVNDRILMDKPMVITTNLTNDEIKGRYSPQILSRFRGNFQRMPFVGKDIRVLSNLGGSL